jgi:hypothetical protein
MVSDYNGADVGGFSDLPVHFLSGFHRYPRWREADQMDPQIQSAPILLGSHRAIKLSCFAILAARNRRARQVKRQQRRKHEDEKNPGHNHLRIGASANGRLRRTA